MKLEEFINKHKPLSVWVEYNEHKNNYETIEKFFERLDWDNELDNVLDKEECIKQDTVYRLQVYPSTPIGFCLIFASTLEKAVNEMDRYFSEEKICK